MRLYLLTLTLGCAPLWSGSLTITGGSADTDTPRLVTAPARDTVIVTLPDGAATPPRPEVSRPVAEPQPDAPRPKAAVPPDFQKDPAAYLQRFIGSWRHGDATALLGEPLRHRNAYDEARAVNGQIYAFPDPSGRYKEVELDFDNETAKLRTVLVYPRNLTWDECHHRWSGSVSSADANNGRTFYSYEDRRLDVLVGADGKVISLGLY